MTLIPRLQMPEGLRAETARRPARGLTLGALFSAIGRWIEVLADHYAAAALYEELSRLSDAELRRRGLSRASLARDVLAACDRAAFPQA
jgi:hypothetical protein